MGQTGKNIYTYVKVRVSEVLKGSVQGEYIVLKQEGGAAGDEQIIVDGAPKYKLGQQVLLFLNQLPDGALTVAYLFQSKYDIVEDERTGRRIVKRTIDGDNIHLLPGHDGANLTNIAELSAFTEKIRNILAGAEDERADEKNYQNLPLRSVPEEYKDAPDSSANGQQTPDFTFIQGGVRWFQPDSGTSDSFSA